MDARCACGAIAAETDAEPLFAIACHCRECQRRTGSPFGAGVYYPRDRVTIAGATTEYARPTDTGGTMRNRFCAVCGTTIAWTIDAHPDLLGVAIGTIEGEPAAPVHSLWERSKRSWIDLAAAEAHHPAGYPTG